MGNMTIEQLQEQIRKMQAAAVKQSNGKYRLSPGVYSDTPPPVDPGMHLAAPALQSNGMYRLSPGVYSKTPPPQVMDPTLQAASPAMMNRPGPDSRMLSPEEVAALTHGVAGVDNAASAAMLKVPYQNGLGDTPALNDDLHAAITGQAIQSGVGQNLTAQAQPAQWVGQPRSSTLSPGIGLNGQRLTGQQIAQILAKRANARSKK